MGFGAGSLYVLIQGSKASADLWMGFCKDGCTLWSWPDAVIFVMQINIWDELRWISQTTFIQLPSFQKWKAATKPQDPYHKQHHASVTVIQMIAVGGIS